MCAGGIAIYDLTLKLSHPGDKLKGNVLISNFLFSNSISRLSAGGVKGLRGRWRYRQIRNGG